MSTGKVGDNSVESLAANLGYEFAEPGLLKLALTHTSWRNESIADDDDNERLEFLGDAVLELAISHLLFDAVPNGDEGQLTQRRARLVNTAKLAEVARSINLGAYLRLGVGEEKSGGRDRPSCLANALEAVIGAIYIDGGYEHAQRVVRSLMASHLGGIESVHLKDARSRLQEWAQAKFRAVPRYEVRDESTPHEEPSFHATVRVGAIRAEGRGRTKKEAIHRAAQSALAAM